MGGQQLERQNHLHSTAKAIAVTFMTEEEKQQARESMERRLRRWKEEFPNGGMIYDTGESWRPTIQAEALQWAEKTWSEMDDE